MEDLMSAIVIATLLVLIWFGGLLILRDIYRDLPDMCEVGKMAACMISVLTILVLIIVTVTTIKQCCS